MSDLLYRAWLPPVMLADRLFEPGRHLCDDATMAEVFELLPAGLTFAGRDGDGIGRFMDSDGFVAAYVQVVPQ